MTKYIIGEIFSSGRATLYKNSSDQTVMQEYKLLKEEQHDPEIHASPIDENNMLLWKAVIVGPQDMPYENGIFNLVIEFSTDYPYTPPSRVVFISSMFHPNVSATGPGMVITRTSDRECRICEPDQHAVLPDIHSLIRGILIQSCSASS